MDEGKAGQAESGESENSGSEEMEGGEIKHLGAQEVTASEETVVVCDGWSLRVDKRHTVFLGVRALAFRGYALSPQTVQ